MTNTDRLFNHEQGEELVRAVSGIAAAMGGDINVNAEISDIVNVYGAKNLIPNSATSQTKDGITFTVNSDGSVTANGTASANTRLEIMEQTAFDFSKPLVLNGGANGNCVTIAVLFDSAKAYLREYSSNGADRAISNVTNAANLQIIIWIANGTVCNNVVFKPMVRLASIKDATYVPYSKTNLELTQYAQYLGKDPSKKTVAFAPVITVDDALGVNAEDVKAKVEPIQDLHGYSKPWVGGAGKNLCPNNAITQTKNGVTFTVNSDGTVTLNGKCTHTQGYIDVKLAERMPLSRAPLVAGQSYIVSGAEGGSNSSYRIIVVFYDANDSALQTVRSAGNTETFTINSNATQFTARIDAMTGYQLNNVVAKPMIRLATISDGTYEPYSNICAISGWSSVDVTRCGKNLFDKNATDKTSGKYLTSDGSTTTNSAWSISEYIAGKGNIVLSAFVNESFNNVAVCWYDQNKTYVGGIDYGNITPFTFNMPSNAVYFRFSYKNNCTDTAQAELGSTPTPYEPYQGKDYLINLGGTYYGGTLDVTTGELTLTHGYVDLGNLSWRKYGIYTAYDRYVSDGIDAYAKEMGDGVCSHYPVLHTWQANALIIGGGASRLSIFTTYGEYADAATFKTAMSGAQLCYELETPYYINLTSTDIQLLQNQNTLFADSGDIYLEYRPNGIGNIGETLGELQNEDAALVENTKENGAVNLLENKANSTATSGVIITVNADKTISFNNTSTNVIFFPVNDTIKLKKGRYRFTCCPAGGNTSSADNNYGAYVNVGIGSNHEKIYWDIGDGTNFEVTDDTDVINVRIRIRNATVCNNLTFKPMISSPNLNLYYDDYVPYAKSNKELTDDFSNLLITKVYKSSSNLSIPIGVSDYTFSNISVDGYKFVGIVGTRLESGGTVVLVYARPQSSTSFKIRVNNTGSETKTNVELGAVCLFCKSNSFYSDSSTNIVEPT